MTRLERERDAATITLCDALAELTTGVMQDQLRKTAKRLKELCVKQEAEDRNGARRVMGKKDCVDLPIPGDDCAACKGTGMRGPDRTCGACEGTGIAGAAHALPEAEAVALRKIIMAGMNVWGGMSCGVETEWVVDTILALLDGGDSMSDDDLVAAARKVYEVQWGEIKAARAAKKD